MKPVLTREFVPAAKRRPMTKARKRRIWEARGGVCVHCEEPVEMYGPTVRYDHELALELGGSDEDHNIAPIHRSPCDEIKTAQDATRIAEMRRQQKMRLEVPREPSKRPILNRKTNWPKGREIPSRPFQRRKA